MNIFCLGVEETRERERENIKGYTDLYWREEEGGEKAITKMNSSLSFIFFVIAPTV
jgi:hypothetical protein